MTSQSFWARFGWMMLPVDGFWYEALKLMHVVTALGLVKLIVQAWRDRSSVNGLAGQSAAGVWVWLPGADGPGGD